MPSKTFEGKDKYDLDKQIWDWKSANPKVKELKRESIKSLPLTVTAPTMPYAKKESPNIVSIRIDYDDSN